MDGKGRKPPVLIHPGSGGRRKICPLEHWWGLLDWLMKGLDRPVVMTLGPADDDLKDFALAVKERGAWVAEGLSLPVLVALLDRSSCYLGSDSGVSHLAAAVGVPSLAVFGPTDPAVWGPVGPRVRIIQSRWRDGENLDWTPAKLRHEDKDTGPAIKEWLKNWV
jgi:ADP-heptose:LPS heptosyltransferase